jgi:membrane-associated phospholipid phosphatase
MWRFLYPSPVLWIGLAAITLVDLVLMAAGGFRMVGLAGWGIAAVIAAACGIGYVYAVLRPDDRLAALAFGGAYLIAYTFAAALLSYLGTSLALPLLDAQFARADAALGLDWMAALEFADRWPAIGMLLRVAYATSMPQVLLVFLVLATTHQLQRLADFIALFTATSLVTVLTASLLPSAGAFVHFDPPAALRHVVGANAGIWHLEHFEALRSGALRAIDPGTIEGLVTFPSFHTALAVITVWALWRTPYLAIPALALNALVIASTVPVGGHYFVDILAGLAVAGAAIGTLAWWRSGARLGQWWTPALGSDPMLTRVNRGDVA